jgi:hypothetical protein
MFTEDSEGRIAFTSRLDLVKYRTSWRDDNALDSHSRGTRLRSRAGHCYLDIFSSFKQMRGSVVG